jgi:hypothetical protein
LAVDESVHDFWHVRDGDATVKEVVWLDQNGDPSCTLIEATRCAHARFEFRQSARGYLRFQRFIYFFRAFRGAASLRVVVGPTIDANEEISPALCHLKPVTDRYSTGSVS